MVHQDTATGHQRQAGLLRQPPQIGQTLPVTAAAMQGHTDPRPPGEVHRQPACLLPTPLIAGQQQCQATAQPALEIRPPQQVTTLLRTAAPPGDEFGKIAVAFALHRQQHQPQAVLETKLGTDDELQAADLRFAVGPHHTSQRTLVGDGQGLVAELCGTPHQLFRMRGRSQKAEVGAAVQFRIAGLERCVHTSSINCLFIQYMVKMDAL